MKPPRNAITDAAPCRVHDPCARCFGPPNGGLVTVEQFGARGPDFQFHLCRACLADMASEFGDGDDEDHDEDCGDDENDDGSRPSAGGGS